MALWKRKKSPSSPAAISDNFDSAKLSRRDLDIREEPTCEFQTKRKSRLWSMLLCVLFVIAPFGISFSCAESSDAFKVAVQEASKHPVVVRDFGLEPQISISFFDSYSFRSGTRSKEASFAMRISGNNTRGKIHVRMTEKSDVWNFKKFDLKYDSGKMISLGRKRARMK
jgi:hypothetical protein